MILLGIITHDQRGLFFGRGYGWRLMFVRSWVRIPALYTGWTLGHFSHWFVVKIALFVWKDRKNQKRPGLAHFLRRIILIKKYVFERFLHRPIHTNCVCCCGIRQTVALPQRERKFSISALIQSTAESTDCCGKCEWALI